MGFTSAAGLLVSVLGVCHIAVSIHTQNGTATAGQELQALKVNMKMMTDCFMFTTKGLDTKLETFKNRLDQLEIQLEQQLDSMVNRVERRVTRSLEQQLTTLQRKQRQLESQTEETEVKVDQLGDTVSHTEGRVNQVQSQVSTLYSEKQMIKNAVFSANGIHRWEDRYVNKDAGDHLIFYHISTNPGGHYSTRTGKYTCPVTGTYFFHYSVYGYNIKNYVSAVASAKLVKDGDHLVEVYFVNSGSTGIYNTLSNAMVLRCNAEEKVWLESHHPYNHLYNWPALNMFSGFLISVG